MAGVLRIIVPDAEAFVRAYVAPGWDALNRLSAQGERFQDSFATKMEVLNHVFIQGYEHFGGCDFETLRGALIKAGFQGVSRRAFREGRFPGGCIDRAQHKPYSLYVEATK
jgi:hypothetical protein